MVDTSLAEIFRRITVTGELQKIERFSSRARGVAVDAGGDYDLLLIGRPRPRRGWS